MAGSLPALLLVEDLWDDLAATLEDVPVHE